jgi:spore coat protein U-like protein
LDAKTLPGSGHGVTVSITLNVTQDCRFEAGDIDFGAAPFADSFDPVTGQLAITCTRGATYSVGLSAGNASDGGRRRMSSGIHRLEYDIYQAGGVLWNDTSQRVFSTAPAAGNAAEIFSYEARIYADQNTPPLGAYADTVIIDVVF